MHSSFVFVAALAAMSPAAIAAPKSFFVYFGTYTGAKSKGIYVSRFDASSGKLAPLAVAAETPNPSFVAPHPNGRFLYAVTEDSVGSVSAFSIDPKTGMLTFLNKVSSHGNGPCFVRVDNAGKNVLVANYGSGSFAVLPIDADGKLYEATSFIQDEGKGFDPNRQEGPHAHSLNPSPDNRFAIGADLGLDKLLILKFDAIKGTLTADPVLKQNPGSGPRLLSFHPNGKYAYVTNELSSKVTVFSWNAASGELHELQSISTLPSDFKGENTSADILVHPSGKFLYNSNRGADSIAVFSIDRQGKLKAIAQTPAGGQFPRAFGIDPTGSFLIVTNQHSENIVVFRIDKKTGRLTPTGQVIELGSPVCVKFVPIAQ